MELKVNLIVLFHMELFWRLECQTNWISLVYNTVKIICLFNVLKDYSNWL